MFILDGWLTGEWQADYRFQWPLQPRLHKKYFELFCKCLHHSLAATAPPHQPPTYSMDLDLPLGDWYGVERHTNFRCYMTEGELFWQNEITKSYQVLKRGTVANFWIPTTTTKDIPFWGHPVAFQRCEESNWTWRPFQFHLHTQVAAPPITPGLVDHDTLQRSDTHPVKFISDGSVHLAHQCAVGAQIIATDNKKFISACFLMTNVISLTLYRAKLEGIYQALKHIEYLGIQPTEISQWCDNKATVKKTALSSLPPKECIAAEGRGWHHPSHPPSTS